jgi:hypothetical protein
MDQILIGLLGGIIGVIGFKLISKGLDTKEIQEIQKEIAKLSVKKEQVNEKIETVTKAEAKKVEELEATKKETLHGQNLVDFFNNRKQ